MSKGREKEFEGQKAEPKGKTNMVRLRNNSSKASGRPVFRAKVVERSDGAHISRMIRSNPGKTAFYDGNNPGVRGLVLGFAGSKSVLPRPPVLVPADDKAREWLQEVQAEAARIAEELAEQ